MSVKTRDWLKFGTLVAMAFALGLAFASAFRLPTRGEAAVRSVLQDTSRPLPQAKTAVERNAMMLQQKLAERTKLLSQLEQAKMQETVARSLESVSQLTAGP